MDHNVTVAIMQPYFLPYIGYWQLMHNVDIFVVYDDIKYTKKGWINRNRFLMNAQPETFTLPLKKDSDYLDVCQRQLSDTFNAEKLKLIQRMKAAYQNAPFFQEGKEMLDDVFAFEEKNLFQFIFQSIKKIHSRLGLTSRLIVSSELEISRQLKGQTRVIAICKALSATTYINPIGGLGLYNGNDFREEGIQIHFQKTRPFYYKQFDHVFVSNLSILDNIMFVGYSDLKKNLFDVDFVTQNLT